MLFYQISRLQIKYQQLLAALILLPFSHAAFASDIPAKVDSLAGATVKLYSLAADGSKSLLATEHTSSDGTLAGTGRFTSNTSSLVDSTIYLYEVSGGSDIDSDDDGIIDALATVNNGLLRAISSGQSLKAQTQIQLSVLTEVAYQIVRPQITKNFADLPSYIDSAADSIINNDLTGDGIVNVRDLLAFDALVHQSSLTRAYQNNTAAYNQLLLEGNSVLFEQLGYSILLKAVDSEDDIYEYILTNDATRLYALEEYGINYLDTTTHSYSSVFFDDNESINDMALTLDESAFYIVDGYPRLRKIDVSDGSVEQTINMSGFTSGEAYNIQVNNSESTAYVSNSSGIFAINLAEKTDERIATGFISRSDDFVVSNDESLFYSIDENSAALDVFNQTTQSHKSISLHENPKQLLLSADEKTLYIANGSAGLAVLNTESLEVTYNQELVFVNSIRFSGDKSEVILSDYQNGISSYGGIFTLDIATNSIEQIFSEADYRIDSNNSLEGYGIEATVVDGLLYLLDETYINVIDYQFEFSYISLNQYQVSGSVDDVLLSDDDSTLYVTSYAGNIDIISTVDGSYTSTAIAGNSFHLTYNLDKSGLYYPVGDSIYQYDFATGDVNYSQYNLVEDAKYDVRALVLGGSGKLYVAHDNQGFKIYDPVEDDITKLFNYKSANVIINSNESQAFVAIHGHEYGLAIVDLTDNSFVTFTFEQIPYPDGMALSLDETKLYIAGNNSKLYTVDLANGNALSSYSVLGSDADSIQLDQTGRYAFLGGGDGLEVVNLTTQESVKLTDDFAIRFAINSTEDTLYIGNDNDGVKVIDISDFSAKDHDADGMVNTIDTDDDNDGVLDINDTFPLDANESVDTDNDNIGDNADTDDDGDGYSDSDEINNGTDPLDSLSMPIDTDGDGLSDMLDTDDDGDGYTDSDESDNGTDPLDSLSTPLDTDGDFTSDFNDSDDDNDGVPDGQDAFPLDDTETTDTDGDGTGNNADTDDDGDGVNDTDDGYPLDSTNTPTDTFDLGPASSNIELEVTQQSYNFMIEGIIAATPMSIVGGEYSLNGDPEYSTETVMVEAFDDVEVRHTSADSDFTTVTTTLTIGDVSGNFSSTTGDATPNTFLFTPQTNVELVKEVTSELVKIEGITIPAKISITNGSYQINGAGGFQTTDGFISNEENIEVRQTSAAGYSDQVDTVITIGGIAKTFSSTTFSCDDLSRLSFPVTSRFINEIETNDNVCEAVASGQKSLTGISSVNAELEYPSDEDWFLLEVAEQAYFSFTTTNCTANGTNTLLEVYDDELTKIAENNDFDGELCSEITSELAAGKYAIRVVNGEETPAGLGSYKLNVLQLFPYITHEQEGNGGSAADGGFDDVEPDFYQEGWVGHMGPKDIDRLIVFVQGGHRLKVNVSDLGDGRCDALDLDLQLSILDSSDNFVAYNDDRGLHDVCPMIITEELPIGQYQIIISEAIEDEGDASFVNDDLYGVEVELLTDFDIIQEVENNDVMDIDVNGSTTNTPLAVGDITFGALTTENDKDNFVFEVPDLGSKDAQVLMTMRTNDGLSGRLVIYNQNFEGIDSSTVDLEGRYPSLDYHLSAGKYFVEIARGNSSPQTGSYYFDYGLIYQADVIAEKLEFVNLPDAGIHEIDGVFLTTQNVAETCGAIEAIVVDIDINHANSSDIELSLTSPSGTTTVLKQFGETAELVGTYGIDLSTVESLNQFEGENINGDWLLSIEDKTDTNVGRLNKWSLQFFCEDIDLDDDGIPNDYEDANGLDKNFDDSAEDLDGDGVTNLEEYNLGTDPQDHKPIADAGEDRDVVELTSAYLSGALSTDPDGVIVNKWWIQTAGSPTVIINDATSSVANFMAPDVEEATVLTFTYQVKDNALAYDSDTVDLTILPLDTDEDGISDSNDEDDDNDGVADTEDAFPLDSSESLDTDGDGIGNNADTDDDNDGVADTEDAFPLDSSESLDTDGDGMGNNADTDDDGDGVADTIDAFPLDNSESVDTDGDGMGNNADTDDDGDGVADTIDAFPLDNSETLDTDGDGMGNNADTDDDNDEVLDVDDTFPLDSTESVDTDGDGMGNNADTDDDNDGVADTTDAFPLDNSESVDTDGDGVGNNADTDDDNDGVADTTDAFPLDNSETLDTDGDGMGNNADTDDDNDEVLDVDDVFPLDSSESVDTDGDGIGNNADDDDDGDGILDEDDDAPLTPFVDTQAPVFAAIEPITYEATGEVTDVSLATPVVIDNYDAEPTVVSDIVEALALGEHQITWTATDAAGNHSSAVQTVNIVDTSAPIFESIEPLVLNAQGRLTDVTDLINATAFDLVDGEVLTTTNDDTNLLSGQHSLNVVAADKLGNEGATALSVSIYPQATIRSLLNVESGSTFTLEVSLSGNAPRYPVNITYQLIENSEVVETNTIDIISGTQGSLSFTVPNDVVVSDNLSLEITEVGNAFIDDKAITQLSVIDTNAAPLLSVSISQNESNVSVVDPDNGLVTFTASISDVNQGNTHDITWASPHDEFDDANNGNIYSIDPSDLSEGAYTLDISVTENNTDALFSVAQSVQFVVEQLTLLDDTQDSDGDGIVDSEEGYSDSDGDGIADYLDDNSNTTQLPSSEDTEPLQTAPGLTMSIGSLAQESGGADSEDASLTVEDLADVVDEDAADTDDSHFEAATPLYNFTIDGLNEQGDSVAVVIPLETGTSLPADAIYRKYNTTNGWYTFVEDASNSVSSALLDDNGNCPTANSASYIEGLTEGDECIQLLIEDGGPNDADFTVNGSVEDPGTVGVEQQNHAPVIDLESTFAADEAMQMTINADVSDADNDELTYLWEQISGLEVELSEVDQTQLSFITPSVVADEILIFELTVTDGIDDATAMVEVTVYHVNQAPTVSINSHDESAEEGANITLISEVNDPDNDSITYLWEQVSGLSIHFDDISAAQVIITLPEVSADEIIEVKVTVTDGEFSTTSTTTFTISNKVEVIVVTPEKKSSGGSMSWLIILVVGLRLITSRLIAKAA